MDAISVALVQEHDGEQHPIYFVSKGLQDAKTRYQVVEKVALFMLTTVRRLTTLFKKFCKSQT